MLSPSPSTPAAFHFHVDQDAVALKAWAMQNDSPLVPPPRALHPGLVLVAEWAWANMDKEQSEHYQRLQTATGEASLGLLYSYPAHATHITVSTLSSFKKPDAPRAGGLSPEADAAFVAAWGDALAGALGNENMAPFELEAYKIELSAGAAFLHFRDPTDSFGRLRALVASVRDTDPELATFDDLLGGRVREAVHLPDIVHSSYARFVASSCDSPQPFVPVRASAGDKPPTAMPDTTIGDTSGNSGSVDGTTLKSRFDAAASRFRPFTVRVTGLTLANECSPYMHQGLEEGTARFFPLQAPSAVSSTGP
mmetsp:Transcript_36525/g.72363  ORF Transcript_36525/g.72363 Transcript_36525/m.72363 type:complete len:309 (+) Transcript_36525:196-1122(+)